MRIFNNIKDKSNFRISFNEKEDYRPYTLEFNIFGKLWVSTRENDKGFFNIINYIYIFLISTIITILFAISNIDFLVVISAILFYVDVIFIATYFVINDKIREYNDTNGELIKQLDFITTNKSKKIVVTFNKDGSKIVGKQLNRLNILNRIIK